MFANASTHLRVRPKRRGAAVDLCVSSTGPRPTTNVVLTGRMGELRAFGPIGLPGRR